MLIRLLVNILHLFCNFITHCHSNLIDFDNFSMQTFILWVSFIFFLCKQLFQIIVENIKPNHTNYICKTITLKFFKNEFLYFRNINRKFEIRRKMKRQKEEMNLSCCEARGKRLPCPLLIQFALLVCQLSRSLPGVFNTRLAGQINVGLQFHLYGPRIYRIVLSFSK